MIHFKTLNSKVKWAKENYHHDLGNPYSLRLASGDTSGVIIVWDVTAGVAKSEFSEGNKPIQGETITQKPNYI